MNKSLSTTIISLCFIIAGFFSPVYQDQILSVGFFAFSGAVTNWLAIFMLFEKIPFIYGSGVVPMHFEEFKKGIRNLIMGEFFTKENLNRFLTDSKDKMLPEINVDKGIESVDYNQIFNSLIQLILESQIGSMLNMFGGPSILEAYREPFKNKISDFIKQEVNKPSFKNAIASSLEQGNLADKVESQVEKIVENRLEELTPQMVKEIIQDMIRKHLGWLVVWGGVFGGLIGFAMSFVNI